MIGLLTTIVGPMFSGKTTELLRLMDRETIAQRNSVLFKPKIDDRYSEDEVVNHNGLSKKAILISNSNDILNYINNNDNELINIFIDEIQFLDSNIITVIEEINNKKINVFTCGLNQTFKGDPFPFKDNLRDIGYLMAISDKVIYLSSICNVCGKEATKTYRIDDKKEATVIIGGIDKYQARCKDCWKK
jgi:thymidine kinase